MIFGCVNSAVLNNTCLEISYCNVIFHTMCFVGIWSLGISFIYLFACSAFIASLNVAEHHLFKVVQTRGILNSIELMINISRNHKKEKDSFWKGHLCKSAGAAVQVHCWVSLKVVLDPSPSDAGASFQ